MLIEYKHMAKNLMRYLFGPLDEISFIQPSIENMRGAKEMYDFQMAMGNEANAYLNALRSQLSIPLNPKTGCSQVGGVSAFEDGYLAYGNLTTLLEQNILTQEVAVAQRQNALNSDYWKGINFACKVQGIRDSFDEMAVRCRESGQDEMTMEEYNEFQRQLGVLDYGCESFFTDVKNLPEKDQERIKRERWGAHRLIENAESCNFPSEAITPLRYSRIAFMHGEHGGKYYGDEYPKEAYDLGMQIGNAWREFVGCLEQDSSVMLQNKTKYKEGLGNMKELYERVKGEMPVTNKVFYGLMIQDFE